jgi:hypothetical protein
MANPFEEAEARLRATNAAAAQSEVDKARRAVVQKADFGLIEAAGIILLDAFREEVIRRGIKPTPIIVPREQRGLRRSTWIDETIGTGFELARNEEPRLFVPRGDLPDPRQSCYRQVTTRQFLTPKKRLIITRDEYWQEVNEVREAGTTVYKAGKKKWEVHTASDQPDTAAFATLLDPYGHGEEKWVPSGVVPDGNGRFRYPPEGVRNAMVVTASGSPTSAVAPADSVIVFARSLFQLAEKLPSWRLNFDDSDSRRSHLGIRLDDYLAASLVRLAG